MEESVRNSPKGIFLESNEPLVQEPCLELGAVRGCTVTFCLQHPGTHTHWPSKAGDTSCYQPPSSHHGPHGPLTHVWPVPVAPPTPLGEHIIFTALRWVFVGGGFSLSLTHHFLSLQHRGQHNMSLMTRQSGRSRRAVGAGQRQLGGKCLMGSGVVAPKCQQI